MRQHQSPTYRTGLGEVGAAIPAKRSVCGAPVEDPWLCRQPGAGAVGPEQLERKS